MTGAGIARPNWRESPLALSRLPVSSQVFYEREQFRSSGAVELVECLRCRCQTSPLFQGSGSAWRDEDLGRACWVFRGQPVCLEDWPKVSVAGVLSRSPVVRHARRGDDRAASSHRATNRPKRYGVAAPADSVSRFFLLAVRHTVIDGHLRLVKRCGERIPRNAAHDGRHQQPKCRGNTTQSLWRGRVDLLRTARHQTMTRSN